MAMAAFPHRIISEAAKRITASLEFRSGDTPPRSVMKSRRRIIRLRERTKLNPIYQWFAFVEFGGVTILGNLLDQAAGRAPDSGPAQEGFTVYAPKIREQRIIGTPD
jgi:hypothetical protein